MKQLDDDSLRLALDKWRKGQASVEEVRSLAADLGNQHYDPGVMDALELLTHEDAIVRRNAAMSLAYEYRYKPATEQLLTMLAVDPDNDCREVAAGGLGNLWQNSKDRRVLIALGKAAIEDPDEYTRSTAYEKLLIVNGVSREEHLKLLTRQGNLPVDTVRVNEILRDVYRKHC